MVACSGGTEQTVVGVDAGSDLGRADIPISGPDAPRGDVARPACGADSDDDTISDEDEGAPSRDTDGDGTPDYMDTDSDGDGFLDADEARRNYPGFEDRALGRHCSELPNNCDAPPDNLPNFRDPDSDNDGLTDVEERNAGTNPCAEDTDGDGVNDLAEVVARSNPRAADSRPPENSLYVVLPYYAPGTTGHREVREFTFSTRIRQADVMLLVDNSASMEPTIANLRTNLMTISTGLQSAITDVRLGVASFDAMPDGRDGRPGVVGTSIGDYTLWVRQRMTTDVSAVQSAFNVMNTISQDTMGRFLGGDAPECQVEAMYELLEGTGARGFEARMVSGMPSPALLSVRNARDVNGNGWVPAVDPAEDCPGAPGAYGWGCFEPGRVPIMVLFSDADWWDGPTAPMSLQSDRGHRYFELARSLLDHGAYFVGIDVSSAGNRGYTYANSTRLALATRTLNASGVPVVFGPATSGGLDRTAASIVTAISTLANETRQDITTRNESDAAESRLPTGRATADFIQSVTPVSGTPPAPTGFERLDATTFYNVLPTTQVVFRATFYNDFMEGTDAARVFQATISVRGRAGSEVDRRPVFIVVPARGGGLPPG